MTKQRLQKFHKEAKRSVETKVSDYAGYYTDHDVSGIECRRREYTHVINDYYDLVTDFYEYGWGRHFHFATIVPGEKLETSLAAHEHYLAYRLHPNPGDKILDVGCGVGGPMSNIARLTGNHITGININDYQVKKGRKYLSQAHLDQQCTLAVADFLHMPFMSGGFHCAYAIEATCHAPRLLEVYTEIYRVLKPAGFFALYEWTLTDRYDPNNAEHCHIKEEIEVGNGIPSLVPQQEVDDALKSAGFQICVRRDRALDCDPLSPWYSALSGETRIDNFRRSEFGASITHIMVQLGEWFHLLPSGTSAVSSILMRSAKGQIAGGRLGIFTPMYFVLAQKAA